MTSCWSRRRRNACWTWSISATCPSVYSGACSSSIGSSDIVVSSRRRGADVRPPVPRLVASGLERLETTAQNLDLARLRALQDGNPYGQHAVRVGRLDLVAVEVLRQVDAAGDAA